MEKFQDEKKNQYNNYNSMGGEIKPGDLTGNSQFRWQAQIKFIAVNISEKLAFSYKS